MAAVFDCSGVSPIADDAVLEYDGIEDSSPVSDTGGSGIAATWSCPSQASFAWRREHCCIEACVAGTSTSSSREWRWFCDTGVVGTRVSCTCAALYLSAWSRTCTAECAVVNQLNAAPGGIPPSSFGPIAMFVLDNYKYSKHYIICIYGNKISYLGFRVSGRQAYQSSDGHIHCSDDQ